MADTCPKCGGIGFLIVEREGVTAATRCSCASDGRAERIEAAAAIPPLYRNASFDFSTSHSLHRDALLQVLADVRYYAEHCPMTPKPGLMLVGEPGTGKTHLAVAALKRLLLRGFEGVFYDYQRLLEQIRNGFDKTSESVDREAYRTALDCQFLLLDDLGAHRITDWVEDTITSIITHRCNNGKPTIVTTNLPDPDAGGRMHDRSTGLPGGYTSRITLSERIGMRARSRLFEMCKVIQMPATEDYRIRRRS